jgi:hypothetical protein
MVRLAATEQKLEAMMKIINTMSEKLEGMLAEPADITSQLPVLESASKNLKSQVCHGTG